MIVLPLDLTCPLCNSIDNAEWDGSLWYCSGCDGQTDNGPYIDATLVPKNNNGLTTD